MKINDYLDKQYSKTAINKIVKYVGDDTERFAELMNLFLRGPYRMTQRAAWPVSYCVEAHPSLIQPWFGKLISNVKKSGIHDSVKRNTVRLLQFIKIPKKYMGDVLDVCMKFLQDTKEPIAVRVFSMTVVANMCKEFPELKDELRIVINDHLPYASAGFKARAKQVLKQLDKNQKVD